MGWEIGEVVYQRYYGGSWGTGAVTVEQTEELLTHCYWTIANGYGDPIDAAWIYWEIDKGSGYEVWAYAKDVEPGYTIPDDPPIQVQPEKPERTFIAGSLEGTFNTRMRLESFLGTFYDGPIEITVEPGAGVPRYVKTWIGKRTVNGSLVGARERKARIEARTFDCSIGKRTTTPRLGGRGAGCVVTETCSEEGLRRSVRLAPRALDTEINKRMRAARLKPRTFTAHVQKRAVAARLAARTLEAVTVRNG